MESPQAQLTHYLWSCSPNFSIFFKKSPPSCSSLTMAENHSFRYRKQRRKRIDDPWSVNIAGQSGKVILFKHDTKHCEVFLWSNCKSLKDFKPETNIKFLFKHGYINKCVDFPLAFQTPIISSNGLLMKGRTLKKKLHICVQFPWKII